MSIHLSRSYQWRFCILLDAVKVVIIGQDPYHGAGQAHGLSFKRALRDSPSPFFEKYLLGNSK